MILGYTDEERLIGDSAINQQKRNFKNTITYLPRLLGLTVDCAEQLKQEEKHTTFKMVPLQNKKMGIEVSVRGSVHVLTPEQIMATYLKKVHQFYKNADILEKDIVVSVPSYFSNQERAAMLDACQIAGLNCVRLLNESTAQALAYGFFRKPEFKEKEERIVVFVDFGHSKLTVSIASFTTKKMKICTHHSDRNLGARDMDLILLEKVGGEFADKYGCDPRKNVRTRLRMLDTIEKQRKILSANQETTINIECLMEDEDLHRNIKRTEFEELVAPLIERFSTVCQEALAKSGKY